MDFTRYVFSDCASQAQASEAVSFEQTGPLVLGAGELGSPTDPFDTTERYAEYGDGDIPYVYQRFIRNSGGGIISEVSEEISGTVEWSNSDSGSESGAVISRRVSRTTPDTYELEWQQGTDSNPLLSSKSLSGNINRVRGPVTYSSSECSEGGQRSISITAPGVTLSNGVPSTGSLSISNDQGSVEVTFSESGAALTFEDGSSAQISREELSAEIADPKC